MDHVTVLLLLWHAAPASQTASEIVAALQADKESVHRALRDLAAGKLLTNESHTPQGPYAFAPAGQRTLETLQALEDAYNRRPVTLIRALYARPPRPIQSFADAFRLHDDRTDDG